MQMDFGANFILSFHANLIYKRNNILYWVRNASSFISILQIIVIIKIDHLMVRLQEEYVFFSSQFTTHTWSFTFQRVWPKRKFSDKWF